MSVARSLNAERPYLHLLTRDEIAAAVEALDEQLDPTGSVVQVGTLEKLDNPYRPGRVSYRLHGVGGEDVIVDYPVRADGADVERKVRELMHILQSHLDEL